MVAGEGLLALALPIWLGPWSDRTRTRLGPRLPFVLAGAPIAVVALVALPFADSVLAYAAFALVFYSGFYLYYSPYRALFPDLVPPERLGRSQGVQTVFREIGLGLALVGSPLLLAVWRPLPFLICAATLAAVTVVFVRRMRAYVTTEAPQHDLPRLEPPTLWALLRERPEMIRILVANALWEFSMTALRTFVVLFIVVGLGHSPETASGLMAVIAVITLVAAPVAGNLGDRLGMLRVIRVSLFVFGVGLLLPLITLSIPVLLAATLVVGFAGGVAMTLPFALVAKLLPRRSSGAGAGLFDFSRGLGGLLGPVLTGVAIDVLRPHFRETSGYTAMWPVIAGVLFLSILCLPSAAAQRFDNL